MEEKIDGIFGHIQRSIHNLFRLFLVRDERGACVLDPELAGTVCLGLLANLTKTQRLIDEVVGDYDKQLYNQQVSMTSTVTELQESLDVARSMLEDAEVERDRVIAKLAQIEIAFDVTGLNISLSSNQRSSDIYAAQHNTIVDTIVSDTQNVSSNQIDGSSSSTQDITVNTQLPKCVGNCQRK